MVRNITFRGSSYHKYVFFGKRTVKQGEVCAIWDDTGAQKLIYGPRRVWVWKSTVKFLDRYFADQQQYLVIKHKSGKREHVRGPKDIFNDPVQFDEISVQEGVHVNNYEVIVVYREEAEDKVKRRVIRGPLLFIPAADEWIHTFVWHGTDADKTKWTPQANKFQKLQITPDQLYYNVRDVRTSDDAQITVKLMVFYEIVDIDKMLDTSQDPIGDIINSVCADVIQKCSNLTYEIFIKSTSDFNSLETFKGVKKMAESIGLKILNVVYRGYQASAKLQEMHDAAIQSRTQLNGQAEVAEQEERLEDLKLTKRLERSNREMQIEQANKEHQLKIISMEHKEELARKEAEHRELLRQREAEHLEEEAAMKRKNDEHLRFYSELTQLGVDLTKYLCLQNQKVDKTIRIETGNPMAGMENGKEKSAAHQPPIPNITLNMDSQF